MTTSARPKAPSQRTTRTTRTTRTRAASTSGTSTADASSLAYVGSKPGGQPAGRDSDAWFTPVRYIEAARAALGGVIELDPFTCREANRVVGAMRFFTAEDDAFKQSWKLPPGGPRTVFLNPPYSVGACRRAIDKACEEFGAGSFDRAVVLVNNATETNWFQGLLRHSTGLCLLDHRISFWNADGKAVSGNTRGQAAFFLDRDGDLAPFKNAFADLGTVLRPAA